MVYGRIVMSKNTYINYYNSELDSFSPMTESEEKELIRLAQKGNLTARNRLVTANLRFVLKMASAYHPKNLTVDDLVGYGNIGLIEAIDKFDLKEEVRFLTFARWWILREINDAVRDLDRTVRIPGSLQAKVASGAKREEELTAAISASSYEGFEDIAADSWYDPQKTAEKQELVRIIADFADCLSDRERFVLYARAGIGYEKPLSMAKIGEQLGVSKTTVQYMIAKIRDKACRSRFLGRFDGWVDDTLAA